LQIYDEYNYTILHNTLRSLLA